MSDANRDRLSLMEFLRNIALTTVKILGLIGIVMVVLFLFFGVPAVFELT